MERIKEMTLKEQLAWLKSLTPPDVRMQATYNPEVFMSKITNVYNSLARLKDLEK